jgi:hypothetical protein
MPRAQDRGRACSRPRPSSRRRGWGTTAAGSGPGVKGGSARARGRVSDPIPRQIRLVRWVGTTAAAGRGPGGTGAVERWPRTAPGPSSSGPSGRRSLLVVADVEPARPVVSFGASRGRAGSARPRRVAGSRSTRRWPRGADGPDRAASTLATSAGPGT